MYKRQIYDKLLPIMAMSALGAVPDDLDFEFNAVRRPDEDEMSDLASKNTDSVTKAFQAGLISQRTALKELRSQSEITGIGPTSRMRTSRRLTTPSRIPTKAWVTLTTCSEAVVVKKRMALGTEKKPNRINCPCKKENSRQTLSGR